MTKNVGDSAALHVVFNANLISIAVVASVKLAKVPATRADTNDKHEPQTVKYCPNRRPNHPHLKPAHHHDPSFFTADPYVSKSVS